MERVEQAKASLDWLATRGAPSEAELAVYSTIRQVVGPWEEE